MILVNSLLAPHPILLSVGSFRLYAHALFFSLGAIAAYLFLLWAAGRRGLTTEGLGIKVWLIFLFGLVGARLSYALLYPANLSSGWEVFQIWRGGLVSYGGILTGLLAAYWLARPLSPHERRQWLDLIGLAGLLAWSIGRLGNFYAGDSVGVLSQIWSLFYQRVPIQLFESLFTLLLFLFLLRFWRQRSLAEGEILFWAALGYLIGRFFIDIWRQELPLSLGIKPSQLACLVGILLLIILRRPFLGKWDKRV